MRGYLSHKWAQVAGDRRGVEVCSWLWEGAGVGRAVAPTGASMIIPDIRPGEQREGAAGDLDFDAIERQDSIDSEALAEIESFQAKGWLVEYRDLKEERETLGSDAVISAFRVLKKEKNGRVKRRLILDLKRSGPESPGACVIRTASCCRASATPCGARSASRRRPPGRTKSSGWSSTWRARFGTCPSTHPVERKYCVGAAAGRIWGYRRAAQGSRNGPLAWAGPASALLRCTQGALNEYGAKTGSAARAQLYVDDSISGSRASRDRMIAMIVLLWRTMGFPLSLAKAQRGPVVTWIGCQLRVGVDAVFVRIDAGKVDELRATTDELLASNVVAVKKLRKFAGVANHFASVLYVWRPFLAELWSAIQSAGTSRAGGPPLHCLAHSDHGGARLDPRVPQRKGRRHPNVLPRRCAQHVRIVGDASIFMFGIGAYLVVGTDVVEWYAAAFHEYELGYLDGDNLHQQTFEALNPWWRSASGSTIGHKSGSPLRCAPTT